MLDLHEVMITANVCLDLANSEVDRLWKLHLPNGPSTTDMAMATLLYRAAEMNLKMADAMREQRNGDV